MKKLKFYINNTQYILAIVLLLLISLNSQAQTTCSGTANIPISGSTTINGVTITPSFTGSVSAYGLSFTSCSTYTTNAGSMWVGQTGAWSVTLNFNKPVNNLLFVITAAGQTNNENFIFNSNGGTISIINQGSCSSSISGNTILSGAGSGSGGGGGYFTISAPSSYTQLIINGAGGDNGSLLAICQASIAACSAGNTAPTIGSNKIANSCPTSTGNLGTLVTSTPPSGTSVTFHSGSPATSANKVANPTVAPVGTYYAAYWDATNNCYSPVSEPIYVAMCLTNTCPATTVDLTTHTTGTTPSNTTLQWHTNNTPSSSTLVTSTNAVGAGSYYATYYDATNNCYSPVSTPIIVSVSNCSSACYKPAITSGTILDTKLGITALGRAGTSNGNWPMIRKGAWIALEAKTKGFVVNRLTAAQIAAIPTANCVEGMMVYDTTNSCLKIYTTTDNGGTYSWQCFNTQTCPDAIPTGAVTGINCNGATNNGILVSGTAASGVNSVISYTGGNGAAYNGQVLASTGVTGLTATLAAGNFASGSGTLTYVITGTPNGSGTASFTINIGGQSCVLTRTVAASAINVRIAQYGTYTIGSAEHPNFKLQLLNTSNYGPSGTYTGASGFTFTDITSTLGTQTAAQLKSNYDIINTGYLAMTVAQAQTIKDFVNLGGVAIVFLDSTSKDFSSIFNIFGHTGTSGDGQQLATASSTESLSSYFGNTLGVALAGSDTMGRVISSQLPAGSRIIATENTGGGIAVWTVGGYNGKVIFVWDEGLFRNPISGANIDTDQEKFVHNLMAYAIDKARGL